MRRIRKIKLGTLLGTGFATLIIISALVAGFGRYHLASLSRTTDDLARHYLTNLFVLQELKDNLNISLKTTMRMLWMTDKKALDASQVLIEQTSERNTQMMGQLNEKITVAEIRDSLKDLQQNRDAFLALERQVIALTLDNKQAEAAALLATQLEPVQIAMFNNINTMIQQQKAITENTAHRAMNEAQNDGNTLLVLALLSALLGTAIAWFITRYIKQILGGEPTYAMTVVQEIARGNLATSVTLADRDNSSLLASMNLMRQSLSNMVTQVRESSDSISTGSHEIAVGSTDLSQRTEQQAASLQQTAASMEEISQTLHHNAETVHNAVQLANTASGTAAKGGDAVNNIVRTMSDISRSSHQISDIIAVIDGIAFQTNILALNAAVEAARAGEQGRGFAVVAGEVRSLAQRSASAAKEIKTLIQDSVSRVDAGSELVNEAGETINELVKQSRQVSTMIDEIGVTLREQESGILMINQAITQLDRVTQQNAALVEESNSAAESLSEQAVCLVKLMSVFAIAGSPSGVAPPQAPRKPALPRLTIRSPNDTQWESF